MSLLERYCPRVDFASTEDFLENFKLNLPGDFNFAHDVVDWYAEHEPGRTALVWCNDRGDELILDFRELRRRADQAANFFKSRGVGKGDAVLLCLKGRWHFWTCLVALHKLGAIAVPATHMMQTKNVVYRLERLNFRMILAAREAALMDNIKQAVAETGQDIFTVCVDGPAEGWEDFNALAAAMPDRFERPAPGSPEATSLREFILLYFTSGTAGFAKMIQFDHAYPLAHIVTARFWQECLDGGLHYTVADTGWAKCAWGKIYGQWLCGAAVFAYDYDAFNAAEMCKRIAHYKVDTFCAPPTVYRMMIREDLTGIDFSNLRRTVIAGEPLNPEVYRRWLEKTGHRLFEAYGQTESVVSVATTRWMAPKPGSMGRPLPIYEVSLMANDGSGRRCERGETGEIVIKADPLDPPPGLFRGYRDDPDLTASSWHDGWYHTGDLAWMDEDGYLWFVSRADDMIKSSGYLIGSFEVESAVMQHPAVLECAVTGHPDPIRGQVVKATVVLAKAHRAPEGADAAAVAEHHKKLARELQNHVKAVTEPYKYPRVVEFVDELPKTISGKIRRVEIRQEDDLRVAREQE
ncbi:MAG: AMP-binding protein [Planctomycetota bacterium]|jgi:acetyl-CoA synthetase|nr:AMP-binding protein [Planctomycetota bacterium]